MSEYGMHGPPLLDVKGSRESEMVMMSDEDNKNDFKQDV